MIKVTVDPKNVADFQQHLKEYAYATRQTVSDCIKEQAALFCQDMAIFTPPVVKGGGNGLSKSAELAGKGAVSGDIRKMFIAVGDKNQSSQIEIVTRNLASATQDGNKALFDRIVAKSPVNVLRGLSPVMRKILNDGNHERAFAKAKNYLNRVPVQSNIYGLDYETDLRSKHDAIKGKFGGRIKRGQRIGTPRMLVESKSILDQYIKERQMSVGKIKSGWLSTLRQIPSPVINGIPKNYGTKLSNAPAFIQRHASSDGYAKASGNDTTYMITVGNKRGDVNGIATDADALNLAIRNRTKMMGMRIKKFLDAIAKRMNGVQSP